LSDIDFSRLPNKKYYSISEVSTLLGIKQTEIRYWEKFDPKLRSNSPARTYNLKRIRLLLEMKILIKDQGIKPGKISSYLKAKKNPRPQKLEIKKELIRIKNAIKKVRKLEIK
jgi:DNA-binding transcriptional MerR regulator